jgi:hypothetical protein
MIVGGVSEGWVPLGDPAAGDPAAGPAAGDPAMGPPLAGGQPEAVPLVGPAGAGSRLRPRRNIQISATARRTATIPTTTSASSSGVLSPSDPVDDEAVMVWFGDAPAA